MSGLGSGVSRTYDETGGGGGVGGGGGSSECALVVETTLNSPVPAVVACLIRGDKLSVEMQTSTTGVQTLVAKDSSGRIAGSLTPPSLIRIITCMQNGYEYEAIVLENVVGGVVRVRIQGKT